MLFFYMLYPSLCRSSMDILSCQSPHHNNHESSIGMPASNSSEYGYSTPVWKTELYLRSDVEEPCFVGEHLKFVLLVAVPSILGYAVGLPLIAFLILWRRRHFLKTKKYIFRLGLVYSGCKLSGLYFFKFALVVCLFVL